ncbi:MAG: hypothetical protein M3552_06885 [Planctomycetota bacterium]|nr:hypothetical protein [Planctomycetaceae bacterium]MDQ3330361.1 hypothetical protein [Planctomycetota bacterium]
MEYAIRTIGRTCSATGVELTPGSLCRSALVERDGRFERLDYALSAWNGPPEQTIGHWRCRVPAAAMQLRRLDTDTLMAEFERLEDVGHDQVQRLRYVLALLLLQKKRLELEDSRSEDDVDYLILVGTKGEGPFEVRDEKLDAEEIATIQRELIAQLAEGTSPANMSALAAMPEMDE